MIRDILIAIFLSVLPISELRGGIPYAIANGINPWLAFLICVIANSLVTLIVFLILDFFHHKLLKWNFYRRNFERYVERNRHKLEKHVGTKYESLFLAIFTAVPLPLTGAYTAAILAWFFGLKRWRSFVAISIGVVIAGLIMTLGTVGLIKLF